MSEKELAAYSQDLVMIEKNRSDQEKRFRMLLKNKNSKEIFEKLKRLANGSK